VAVIGLYVTLFNRRLPKSISDLMAFPGGFGAPEGDWMNLRIAGMEEVVRVSEAIQSACLAHGVDARRSYFAALAMEEMAGNIVRHGLTRDRRRHEIDLRVTWKGDSLVLCIKDDCVRFDPIERLNMLSPEDPVTNIGLRLAHRIALDMSYQSLLGLNVLLIRI
jgi:anti-sigma regulatory factor (Ser/Thr protein kinase)